METLGSSDEDASRVGQPPHARVHVSSLLPVVASWAALHTHPRSEKVVAQDLARRGVKHFLPLTPRRRTYGARVRESLLPLFPGYLFYDAGAADKRAVYASQKVVRVLTPDDPLRLAADLENLARALSVEAALTRVDFGGAGSRVEVVAGPMTGIVGELVRRASETTLVLRVSFLGFGAEVNIDEAFCRPVRP
jgi:transcriptional antiterminator RfaH